MLGHRKRDVHELAPIGGTLVDEQAARENTSATAAMVTILVLMLPR
jgi:hypothetical protein